MILPFFYGWLIVAITMVAGFLAAGVSNITMAVVLKPISEDLGWSRALTAAAITVGACLGGLLSPLFGPIADRLGPRLLLPAGAALVGLLAFGVSLSTEPWQFYVTFVPARALTEFLLCGMIAFTTAANWFYLKRPRVMGLVALSTPLGSAVLSLVYQFFVLRYGWRSAFLALGVALWVFVVTPGLIFLRRRPEDLGLHPDGLATPPRRQTESMDIYSAGSATAERSWSRAEAVRSSTLWLLVSSAFLAAIGTGGVAFHTAAYFTDVRIAPTIAAGAVSVMALSGAFGNGLWGALAERLPSAPLERRDDDRFRCIGRVADASEHGRRRLFICLALRFKRARRRRAYANFNCALFRARFFRRDQQRARSFSQRRTRSWRAPGWNRL